MRRSFRLLAEGPVLGVSCLSLVCLLAACSPRPSPTDPDSSGPTGAGRALRFRYERRLDAQGHMPADGLMVAKGQRDALVAQQRLLDEAGLTRSGWRWLGPANFGGRIRALLPHPTNPSVLWVGAASGGIWKSTDGGATWRPLDDFLASLAVSCLVMDPTDPDVLYAGTGEGFLNHDAVQGAGVFRSTDGGGTWTRLPATDPLVGSEWLYVNRLAIHPTDPQAMLAATWFGVYRTTDAGANWTRETFVRALDVDFHPIDGSKAIAAEGNIFAGNHRVLHSSDGGDTWSAATGLPATTADRIELAYAPAAPDVVFASVTKYDATATPPAPRFGTHGLYRSGDGGHSFLPWNIVTNYLSAAEPQPTRRQGGRWAARPRSRKP